MVFSVPLVIFLLLRNPDIQTVITKFSAEYLSSRLGTKVQIGKVDLGIYGKLLIDNFSIEDSKSNKIIDIKHFEVALGWINRRNKTLRFKKIDIKGLTLALRKYKNEEKLNLVAFLNHFSASEKQPDTTYSQKPPWIFICKNLNLRNTHFIYENENRKSPRKSIDFADIEISDLDLFISDLLLKGDTVQANIQNLAFVEKSGFEISEFSGLVNFSPAELKVDRLKIVTNNSDLDLDFKFIFDSHQAFNRFLDEVRFDTKFRTTHIDMADIGYFAPVMFDMKNLITMKGDISGPVSNIKAKNFEFFYKNSTHFKGTIRMNGLPDIRETFIHASINNLKTTVNDIKQFALPGDSNFIPVPEILAKLGQISIDGKFTGFYNDFVSRAAFETGLGSVYTDLTLRTSGNTRELEYNGKIQADDMDIGELFSIQNFVGKTNFSATIDGKGIQPENADFKLNGNIHSFELNNYKYENILVETTFKQEVFDGDLSIDDENINFKFNGLIDFAGDLPVFKFQSKITDADLFKLNLLHRDSLLRFSTTLDFNFRGNDIDNLYGVIKIDSLLYIEGNKKFNLEKFALQTVNDSAGSKKFLFRSDIFDADFEGMFSFRELFPSFKIFLSNYSGVLAKEIKTKPENNNEQQIDFSINLKETSQLTHLLIPNLEVSPSTTINGSYNTKNNFLKIDAVSPSIRYGNINIQNWELQTNSDSAGFKLLTKTNKVYLKQPAKTDSLGIGIDSLTISAEVRHDSVLYRVLWNDLSNRQASNGDVEGIFHFKNIKSIDSKFTDVEILIDSALWQISDNNYFYFDSTGYFFRDVNFSSSNSSLSIDGGMTANPDDSLNMKFKDLNISYLDYLIANKDIDINGILNGNVVLISLLTNPNFLVDINLSDLFFNDEELGDLMFNTVWDENKKFLDVDLGLFRKGNRDTSEVLSIKGEYYPTENDRNFNIDIKLNKFNTFVLNPFTEKFVEIEPESHAGGSLHFDGTYSKPALTGNVNLTQTKLLIKYLNVLYSAKGSFEIGENFINVNKLKLYDPENHAATCSGNIYHDYFNDFIFDINIKQDNFETLNTSLKDNQLFYGTAIISGNTDIDGPLDNIKMDLNVKTEKETRIFIPISSSVSVSKNDFIIFINSIDTGVQKKRQYNVDLKGFTMALNLDVTSDAQIQLFLPNNMGNIKAKGDGNIRMEIDPGGDFSIDGDYVISRGKFRFTFENIIGRDFDILKGSKISWTGNPNDAKVNLKAIYSVKTTLDGLRLQTDSSSVYNTRIHVDCIIGLTNALFNPDIHFSLDFTNVAEDVKQLIFASLDTTDQSVMSQQFLSLLVLGNFSYTTGSSGNIGNTGFTILANQINNWLSKISQDFDIGINYLPGSQMTEDELEVAMRTQLFNDRLSIDGNFGMRGTSQSQNTSNVVGDINVEYKITKDGRFRIKAFNRTNDISFFEDNAPYTQGVGIFYKKEFNKFKDIFKRDKEKKKRREERKKKKKNISDSASSEN